MKIVERFLIAMVLIVCAGIVMLSLFWAGLALKMVAFGSPVIEQSRVMYVAPASTSEVGTDVATDDIAEQTSSPAQTDVAATAVSAVSADAGEKVFRKCMACHGIEADSGNKAGPPLWGVIGRPVASASDFGYSDALTALSDQVWDVPALQAFLESPKTFAPGNTMAFPGLKKAADRNNLIAYLGQQSDTPQDAAALGFATAAGGTAPEADAGAKEVVEIDPVPYPEGVTYRNPPGRSAEREAEIATLVAELEALVPTLDYDRARYHPLHFPPAAENASNEECLVCHQEILDHEPRAASPAGVDRNDTLAWYQTLHTYSGEQETFHYRHLESDFAKEVMNLECSFCHKGNDPRQESPDMVPTRDPLTAPANPEFTLRKMVNPTETCLRCHGSFDYETMALSGPWHEIRNDMEWPEAPNGCLSCHAESFRTVRHNVDYLKAENIERVAREGSSDSCYGCHGGRAWYQISYPYPRHTWPENYEDEVPEWAADRPTESDPEYALPAVE